MAIKDESMLIVLPIYISVRCKRFLSTPIAEIAALSAISGQIRNHPQPLVSPQVSHFVQEPLLTKVKLKQRWHMSPS